MDKKSNKKYFLNIILILVLGATVIYFTMKDDLHASLRALTTASPLWIVISFALMSIYFLLDGINLYTFGKLYKKDYSYKQGFVNSISGTFFKDNVSNSHSSLFFKVNDIPTLVTIPGMRELIIIFFLAILSAFISNALKSKKAGCRSTTTFFSSSIAIVE